MPDESNPEEAVPPTEPANPDAPPVAAKVKKPRKKKADTPPSDPANPDAPVAAKVKKPRAKKPGKEELLVQWQTALEEGKRHYEAADLALLGLIKKVKVGKTVKHPVTGEEFVMVDNFADGKNVSWKVAGVRHFELKAVKGTKRTPAPVEAPVAAPAPPPEPTAEAA